MICAKTSLPILGDRKVSQIMLGLASFAQKCRLDLRRAFALTF